MPPGCKGIFIALQSLQHIYESRLPLILHSQPLDGLFCLGLKALAV